MSKSNKLVNAALAGIAQAKKNSGRVIKSQARASNNGCNGKGGCGSKK